MTNEQLIELSKQLAAQGKLVEAGWIGLRVASVPADAPQIQLDEMRTAFFAGAQHVFSSLMAMLDPGEDPTQAELARMDAIQAELDAFITAFKLKHGLTEGRA